MVAMGRKFDFFFIDNLNALHHCQTVVNIYNKHLSEDKDQSI